LNDALSTKFEHFENRKLTLYPHDLPPIVLAADEHARLSDIARRSLDPRRNPPVAEALLKELARARVVPEAQLPDEVVSMESRIEYLDCVTDEVRRVKLVYPGDDVSGSRRVSVLSPLGTALIGLRKGQRIAWRTPLGGWLEVEVRSVERDVRAERGGELPRA
jgi:regulator of nucleoside diphosphate kinase